MLLIKVWTKVSYQHLQRTDAVLHAPVLEDVATHLSLLVAKPLVYYFQTLLGCCLTKYSCDESVDAHAVVAML